MLFARSRRPVLWTALSSAVCLALVLTGGCGTTNTGRTAAPSSVPPTTATVTYPPTPRSSVLGPFQVSPPRRIEYAVPGGHADPAQNYGNLYLPTLPAIGPDNSSGGPLGARREYPTVPTKLPVVVLLHGGGWRTPSSAGPLAEMARSLTSHGVAVWNVEYRRIGAGGGYPVTLTDTAAAIDFLQTIKSRYAPTLNLDDVVIAGHSAGGQLAVWAAARSMLTPGAMGSVPAVKPAAVVSMAGVLDMRRAVADGNVNTRLFLGLPDDSPQQYKVADPIQNINPSVPVTCYNGTADRIVHYETCTSFISALNAKGGKGKEVLLPGASHNIYLPSQAQNRYWPVVQESILGYATEFDTPSVADSGGR